MHEDEYSTQHMILIWCSYTLVKHTKPSNNKACDCQWTKKQFQKASIVRNISFILYFLICNWIHFPRYSLLALTYKLPYSIYSAQQANMQDKMIVNNQKASHDFAKTNFESHSIGGCIKIYTLLAYYNTIHLHTSDQHRWQTINE